MGILKTKSESDSRVSRGKKGEEIVRSDGLILLHQNELLSYGSGTSGGAHAITRYPGSHDRIVSTTGCMGDL